MSEQEALAQTLAQIELEQELIPHVIGFHRRTAEALLASEWLRERDARIRAEVTSEYAEALQLSGLNAVELAKAKAEIRSMESETPAFEARIRAEERSAALNLAANMIAKAPPADWVAKAESGTRPILTAWYGGVRFAYGVVAKMKQDSDLQAVAEQGADQ